MELKELGWLARKLPNKNATLARFKVEELAAECNKYTEFTQITIKTAYMSVKQILNQIDEVRRLIWVDFYKK